MSATFASTQSQTESLPAFQRAQYAFTAHVRDPAGQPRPSDVEERRMAIYRDLFFNNVESFISNCYPVIRSMTADVDWYALVRDFYATHVSHSPLFSEIPAEFLAYLEQEKPAELAPTWPFLLELAHYEWLELVAQIAEDELPEPAASDAVDADTLLKLSPLAFVQAYQFPVQHISTTFQPNEAPAEPTTLVVYRNRTDKVQFLTLNPLSYQLLVALESAGSVSVGAVSAETVSAGTISAGTLLAQLATALNLPLERVLPAGLQALQDFARRDIVLRLP